MTDLNGFFYTDLFDDVLAVIVNRLIAGNLRGELTNTETITSTKALTDGDCPIQNLTPSGADQVVLLPPEAAGNHIVVVRNASAIYGLVVKDDSGSTTFAIVGPGEMSLAIPIGGLTWQCVGNKGGVLTAEIDFGATPTFSKVFTIALLGMTPAHKIIVSQSGAAATGKSQDENEMDALILRAVPGTDQFTLYADARPGPVTGKFKINFTYN